MAEQKAQYQKADLDFLQSELRRTFSMSLVNAAVTQDTQGPTITAAQRDAWRVARDIHEQSQPPAAEDPRKDYLAKGVPQPQDGPNVKQDRTEACLTCIKFSKGCNGTDVKGGKCRQCRGESGATTTTRRCLWLDPDRHIFNYQAASADVGATGNPHNTREGIAARKAKKKKSMISMPIPPTELTDLSVWPTASLLLKEVAGEVGAENEEDDMARLEALFRNLAARNFMAGGIDTFADRRPHITAQQVILQTLSRMKESGRGLTIEDIEGLAATE